MSHKSSMNEGGEDDRPRRSLSRRPHAGHRAGSMRRAGCTVCEKQPKGRSKESSLRAPPCHASINAGRLLRIEKGSGPRRGWSYVEGVRNGSGQATKRAAQSGAPSGAAFQESLYSQGGRTTKTTGGQDRSTGSGNGPQPDIRRGLFRILVWVQTKAKPAQRTGCAVGRDHEEESELGAGRRHS